MTTQLSNFKQLCTSALYGEVVIESFAITDMTAATSAVLICSESKGSGFHANECP